MGDEPVPAVWVRARSCIPHTGILIKLLRYRDGMPPYAQVQLPPLVSQQPYDISLHLVVPASTANYELGNFMTTLTLSTPSNKTVASVRRAVCTTKALKGRCTDLDTTGSCAASNSQPAILHAWSDADHTTECSYDLEYGARSEHAHCASRTRTKRPMEDDWQWRRP